MNDTIVNSYIEVRLQVPGIHFWPEAPKKVEFLAVPHHHMFHIRVRAEVQKSREIEFLLFRAKVKSRVSLHYPLWAPAGEDSALYKGISILDFGSDSCEIIAKTILDRVYEAVEVEVSENGENGAVVTRRVINEICNGDSNTSS